MTIDRKLVTVAILGALVVTGHVRAEGALDPGELSQARDVLSRWVETRQLVSREREDWVLARDVLERRIDLLKAQSEETSERTRELSDEVDTTVAELRKLQDEQERLDSSEASLGELVARLEARTRELLPRLPQPLRQRVEPLARRLPAADAVSTSTLGQRFQTVVGVLNEASKFDRDVALSNEVRVLPDGSRAEVQALYLGLGQGYYVTADGAAAGVGWPEADGWQWSARPELGAAIQQAIAILRNEQIPAHVPLSVTLR